jgi:hypothetical protein
MRGFQQQAIRQQTTDSQRTFRGLSRHRRTKLARAAHTTLLKADQWSRGSATTAADVATALDGAVRVLITRSASRSPS